MIQLTRSGAVVTAGADDVARLRARFDRDHCILLPRLIEPAVLETIQQRIDAGTFVPFVHEGIGHDSNLEDQLTIHLLFFLTNDPRFLQIVRDITSCPAIDSYHGRVYRLDPAASSEDSWHDDMIEHRMVGMSVNLSKAPFSGAVFQLRDAGSKQVLHEVANTGRGDAIIFRLSHHLQHRNTGVTGTAAKTAFAGWFRSHQRAYHSWIRDQAAETR